MASEKRTKQPENHAFLRFPPHGITWHDLRYAYAEPAITGFPTPANTQEHRDELR